MTRDLDHAMRELEGIIRRQLAMPLPGCPAYILPPLVVRNLAAHIAQLLDELGMEEEP